MIFYTKEGDSGMADVSRPFGFVELWSQQAPDAIAIDDGTHSFTYREVRNLAKQIAGELRERGIAPGDVVALDLPSALSCLIIAAAFHEGWVTCQLPPAGTTGFVADWLLTSREISTPLAQNVVVLDSAFTGAVAEQPTTLAPTNYPSDEALCRIVFSSGTTGTPKPIALTCAMVSARAEAANDLIFGSAPFLCTLDLGSASGFHTLLGAFMAGSPYLIPGTPDVNVSLITRHRVSAIKASPVQIQLLLDAALRAGVTLSSLEVINSAGSVVPVSLRNAVRGQTKARLVNLFGSSEVGRAAEHILDDDDVSFAGVVVAGTDLEIVDEQDAPLALGQPGRVRYRRAHQALEYFNNPEATAAVFKDGWFYTGDIGRLEEGGRLYLVGRTSDVINAGGVKVNPAEADQVALAVAGVTDAAGFAHVSDEGVTEFGMALVLDDGADVNAVIAELRRQLGSLAPTVLFTVPAIARNAAGKIVRSEVAAAYKQALGRA